MSCVPSFGSSHTNPFQSNLSSSFTFPLPIHDVQTSTTVNYVPNVLLGVSSCTAFAKGALYSLQSTLYSYRRRDDDV